MNACVEHEVMRLGGAIATSAQPGFMCRQGKRMCDTISVPVLTVKQPWAWLISQGHQDILSRHSATAVRGLVLLYAAPNWDKRDFEIAADLAWATQVDAMPLPQELSYGGIVGVARVSECVQHSESVWFTGKHGIVFEHARSVPFMPLRVRNADCDDTGMFKADLSRLQAFRLGLIT